MIRIKITIVFDAGRGAPCRAVVCRLQAPEICRARRCGQDRALHWQALADAGLQRAPRSHCKSEFF
jgi:hypothetical protein